MDIRKIAIGIIILLLILPAVSFSEMIKKKTKENPDGSIEYTIYKDDKQIAKEIFDSEIRLKKRTGKIPDGIVKETYDITTDEGKKFIIYLEWNYKNNKLEGIAKVYYDSGKLLVEWNYKNDKLEGIFKEYYEESGKLMVEKNYKNDKCEGISKEYYESGKLKTENNYKDDKLEGISKEYYKNGKLREEENYKDGKLEGITKGYYENGKLSTEWNYKNGKLEGISKVYYEDGKLSAERNYKNVKLEGISKEYYEDGKLSAERNYKDGKLEGISKVYYENGEIRIIDTYKKGHKINSKKYDTLGKLILDQDYPYPEEEVFTDEGIIQGLSDTLRTSFFKTGKFTVLERTKMDEILKEQKFQLTGCTTNECAVEIGKILNVNYIAIASVAKIGKEYVLNIRIVNVESSEVVIADMERSDSEKELIDAIDKLVVSIGNRMAFRDDNTKLILSGVEVSIAVLDVDVK